MDVPLSAPMFNAPVVPGFVIPGFLDPVRHWVQSVKAIRPLGEVLEILLEDLGGELKLFVLCHRPIAKDPKNRVDTNSLLQKSPGSENLELTAGILTSFELQR